MCNMEGTKTTNCGSEKLIALDKKHRLNYEDEATVAVQDGITSIMENLVQKIRETEPVFKGQLLTCGSMKNRTKIGKPDEIDFGFHWDLSESRAPMISDVLFLVPERPRNEGPGTVPGTNIVLVDQVRMLLYFDEAYQGFNLFRMKPYLQYIQPEYTRVGFHIHDISQLHKYFKDLVDYTMEQLILPQGWTHGGYNSPMYSGHRGTGASTMFQFIYNDEVTAQPLFVSVDFVMLMEVRECYKGDVLEMIEINSGSSWLQEFLTKNNCYEKVWIKISGGDSKADHSLAIRKWLETFDMESPIKIVIRVLKCLSMLAFTFPEADHLQPTNSITKFIDIVWRLMNATKKDKRKFTEVLRLDWHKRPTHEFQTHDIRKPEGKRFADIGEHIDCLPYVRSYTMLVLIVSMFCAKVMKHPDLELCDIWKLDDVDSIVTDVLMLLFECVESGCLTLKDANGREFLEPLSIPELYTKESVLNHVKQMIKIKSKICGK